MNTLKKTALLIILFALLTSSGLALDVIYLYVDDCPVCEKVEQFMAQYDHVKITKIHASDDPVTARSYGIQWNVDVSSVPIVHIQGETFIGFNDLVQARMKRTVEMALVLDEDRIEQGLGAIRPNETYEDPVMFWDSFQSPILVSAAIGLIDGFNPCTIWAMLFIITIIFRYRDQRKLFLVGGLYLITLSSLYAVFILGIYSVFNYLQYIPFFKWIYFFLIIMIALVGLFDPDKLTIPDKWAARFKKEGRSKLISENQSFLTLSLLSISLAFFATLIELPCTAGFPLIWNAYMATLGDSFNYYLGLAFYLGGYILVEATILTVALVTAKKIALTKEAGLVLKRISSIAILLLGIWLLFNF